MNEQEPTYTLDFTLGQKRIILATTLPLAFSSAVVAFERGHVEDITGLLVSGFAAIAFGIAALEVSLDTQKNHL